MSHHINRRGFFQSLKLGAAGTASVVVSPSSEPGQAAADDLLPFETSRSIRRDKSPVTPERVLLWEKHPEGNSGVAHEWKTESGYPADRFD